MTSIEQRRQRFADLTGRQPNSAYFSSTGEFLQAVAAVGLGNVSRSDPRLEYAAASGLTGTVSSDGGFLIPAEQALNLFERTFETGGILSRVTKWPAGREKFRVPLIDESSRADGSRFGGISMTWTAPGEEITASRPKFAIREHSKNALKGLIYATEELLADGPTLGAIFERLYSLEASYELEDSIINGSGAGRPQGILGSNALITVAKESGQAGSTVVAANIQNMVARLWGPSHRNAVWLCNQDALPQLMALTLGSGTSQVELFRWRDDGLPLLAGKPVLFVEYTATLGTVGDLILFDPSEYMLADSGAISIAFSPDVRFTAGEGAFKFVLRTDGHLAWSGPITPSNGTATQSPVVALATRA